MAQAPTKANGGAEKAKRGDGPVTILYLDDAGATAKRVSEKTTGIRVAGKDGKTVDFPISALSPATRNQLVALAIQKRVDTYVRNSVKADDASNAIDLANSVWEGLKTNTIYSRKEGGGKGAGRPFDTSFYREVYAETARIKKQTVSEKQLDAVEMKLKASTPKERKELISRAMEDKVFKVAYKKVEAHRLGAQIKKDGAGDVDALSLF